jgi:hypothetical protein
VLLLPRLLYPPLTPVQLRGVPSAKERIELQQTQSSLQNDARTPLLQALGGLLLVAGVIATWQQVLIGREGQITERFTRAVDQVGSAMLDVRIGGILALERIARDSERDQQPVAQLLEAFVRIHAPWRFSEPYPTPTIDRELPWLRDRAPDVQTSLWVLGTRLPRRAYELAGLNRVDLRRSYLSGFWLPGASFWKANLARSHMRGIHLEGAELSWVDLREAIATNGVLAKADLSHACLDDADFQGVNLQEATLLKLPCGMQSSVTPTRRRHASAGPTCQGPILRAPTSKTLIWQAPAQTQRQSGPRVSARINAVLEE